MTAGATAQPAAAANANGSAASWPFGDVDKYESSARTSKIGIGETARLIQLASLLDQTHDGVVLYHGVARPVYWVANDAIRLIDRLPKDAQKDLADLRALAQRQKELYAYQATATYRCLQTTHVPGSILGSVASSGMSCAASGAGSASGASVTGPSGCCVDGCEGGIAASAMTTAVVGGSGVVTGLVVNEVISRGIGILLSYVVPTAWVAKAIDACTGRGQHQAIRGFYADRAAALQLSQKAIEEMTNKLDS